MIGVPRRCYVVDKMTGRVVSEHASSYEACRAIGRKSPSAVTEISRKSLFGTSRYVVRFADEYDPRESFESKRKGVPLFAVRGREVMVFTSVKEAAAVLHVAPSTLYDHVRAETATVDGLTLYRMPRMGALNKVLGLEERC